MATFYRFLRQGSVINSFLHLLVVSIPKFTFISFHVLPSSYSGLSYLTFRSVLLSFFPVFISSDYVHCFLFCSFARWLNDPFFPQTVHPLFSIFKHSFNRSFSCSIPDVAISSFVPPPSFFIASFLLPFSLPFLLPVPLLRPFPLLLRPFALLLPIPLLSFLEIAVIIFLDARIGLTTLEVNLRYFGSTSAHNYPRAIEFSLRKEITVPHLRSYILE